MSAKIYLTIFLTLGFLTSFQLYAQKTPDVQEVGMKAPTTTKVDGKNLEWNDTFAAKNKRTNIWYSLSNDDKYLYLVVKSTDVPNNTKILAGGITLSINPDGKRKEKESISLTYPLINRANARGGQRMRGNVGATALTPVQRDSATAAQQKIQLLTAKEIKVKGFIGLTDTLVSIYNTEGIKAYASIGADHSYFYEAAIPLSFLGITTDRTKEFAYNIKINGLQVAGFGGAGGGGGGGRAGGAGGGGNFGGARGGGGQGNAGGIDMQALMSPTDFWGKYQLVKQ